MGRRHLLRALATVAVAAALPALAACGDDDNSSTSGAAATTGSGATSGTTSGTSNYQGVTLSSYNSITIGMTRPQVQQVTGVCPQTNSVEKDGHKVAIYQCDGQAAFTGATFIFSDGTLAAKSQTGLDGNVVDNKGQMTKAAYDKLQTGQTEAEVTAITGPCTKTGEGSFDGKTGFALTCFASTGTGSAVLTFIDGTLYSKSQNGLS